MPRVVVAGSENDPRFAIIDFSGTPQIVLENPGFGGGCRVDIGQNIAAVGSVLTGDVTIYDVSQPNAPVKGGAINTFIESE